MNTITINVGGKNMMTHKSTLEQLNYFKNILERWNKSDNIFIDYDPDLFIHLLNKLRDNNYVMPNNDNINSMCEYFGLSLNEISPKIIKVKIMDTHPKEEFNPKAILDIFVYHPYRWIFCAYKTDSSKILEVYWDEDFQVYFKIVNWGNIGMTLKIKYLKLLRQQNTNIYFKIKNVPMPPHSIQTNDLSYIIVTMKV